MRLLLSLVLVLLASSFVAAQPKGGPLKPDDALKALKVADGFQVELFAAEPMLINPTCIDVDHKGRVWVAEAVNYRRKTSAGRSSARRATASSSSIDTKGDGKATRPSRSTRRQEIYRPARHLRRAVPGRQGRRRSSSASRRTSSSSRTRTATARPTARRRSSSPASAASTTTTASTASTSAPTASSTSPSATRA